MTTIHPAAAAPSAQAGPAPLKAGCVARTKLLSRLEARLDKKLVLVRAPAGYGKTAFLHQLWEALDDSDAQRVWLGLVAGDADPASFAAAFGNAITTAGIDLGGAAEPKGGAAAPEGFIAQAAQALEGQARDVVIFIDEYQNAQSAGVDRLLKILLQRTTRRTRVILAARSEPACGAAKMRLDGELTEVTHAGLAFDAKETRELFDNRLSQSATERLTSLTEGWPAALRLAKLWIEAENRSLDLLASFSGDLPDVASYLAQEVFLDLPDDAQTFLSETSILPYFDAEIADEVLSRHDSKHMLPRLEGMDAFILPVDADRRQYRHHPLIAQYFRSRLHATRRADDIAALYGRAADYFHRHGDLLFALEHAIDGGDESRTENIINDPECSLNWLTVDFDAFTRVMQKLHWRTGPEHLRLMPTHAFYLIKKGQFQAARKKLDAIKARTGGSAAGKRIRDDYTLIDAIHNVYTDDDRSGELVGDLKEARQTSEVSNSMYWGVLNNALGMLLFREGKIDEADKTFDQAIDYFRKAQSHFSVIHNLLHRGMISVLKADMRNARSCCDKAQALHERYLPGHRNLAAVIDIGRAELDYQAGELERASDLFDTARTTIVASGDFWVELLARAFCLEARLKYARQGLESALALLGQGFDLAREHRFDRLRHALVAQKIHLAAIAENVDLAESTWEENKSTLNYDRAPAHRWRENAELALALVRLDISRGRAGKALAALDEFREKFPLPELKAFTLKAQALRALALYVDERPHEAATVLRDALEVGEARNMRSFVMEEGLLAQQLIDDVARRFSRTKQAEDFNQKIRKWLTSSSDYLPPEQRLDKPDVTDQQKRILQLLVQGLDRQAIADQTQTTPFNVSYHITKMFKRFGVSSSTRLAAEALRLKIVDDPAGPS